MKFLKCVIGTLLLIYATMTPMHASAREIGERYMDGLQECIVTDKWRDPTTNTEVTTTMCCDRGEILQDNGACVNTLMQEFFEKSWNYVTGLGLPGFDLPPTGGFRPPGTPDEPTKALCDYLQNDCQTLAAATVRTCESDMLDFRTKQIDPKPYNQTNENGELHKPGTCFGETEEIISRINQERGSGGEDCSFVDVYNTYSPNNGFCRHMFQRYAFENCLNGLPGRERASGANIDFEFDLGGFGKMGLGVDSTIKISRAQSEGDRTYCAANGSMHAKACNAAHQACLNKAGGVTPLQTALDLDSEAQSFVARIDRARLGLDEQRIIAIPVPGSFRPIARNLTDENKVRYVARMKFLAKWSEFIKQQSVTTEQQNKIQLAFEGAQTTYQAAESRLIRLLANYLIPDRRLSYWDGQRLDYLELLKYTDLSLRFREYDKRMKGAQGALEQALLENLGQSGADQFPGSVWTNIYDFGNAAPMNRRQGEASRPR